MLTKQELQYLADHIGYWNSEEKHEKNPEPFTDNQIDWLLLFLEDTAESKLFSKKKWRMAVKQMENLKPPPSITQGS